MGNGQTPFAGTVAVGRGKAQGGAYDNSTNGRRRSGNVDVHAGAASVHKSTPAQRRTRGRHFQTTNSLVHGATHPGLLSVYESGRGPFSSRAGPRGCVPNGATSKPQPCDEAPQTPADGTAFVAPAGVEEGHVAQSYKRQRLPPTVQHATCRQHPRLPPPRTRSDSLPLAHGARSLSGFDRSSEARYAGKPGQSQCSRALTPLPPLITPAHPNASLTKGYQPTGDGYRRVYVYTRHDPLL